MKTKIFIILSLFTLISCSNTSSGNNNQTDQGSNDNPIASDVIHVTSINIEDFSNDLCKVGGSIKLNVSVLPSNASDKSLAYKSSDETIATISGTGLINFIKEGEVTFTVTSNDGNKVSSITKTIVSDKQLITKTEIITASVLEIKDGHTYYDYEYNSANSLLTYSLNAMYNDGDKINHAIQLRSKNENSGIVITKNTNNVIFKEISITWNTLTNTNGNGDRYLQIYGKNSVYDYPSDLYSSSSQGSLLKELKYDTETTFTFDDEYSYIGLRSADGAVYLNEISITYSYLK